MLFKSYYFPHFADGGGFSTQFSVSNSDPVRTSSVTGTLRFFDVMGNPLDLPFSTGPASQLPIQVGSRATAVFSTLGTSNPMLSGYAVLEVDQEPVVAAAVVKMPGDLEATVLPVLPGRRFAMFAERTPTFETAIALVRLNDTAQIEFGLWENSGNVGEHHFLRFAGRKLAKLGSEISFRLLRNFTGMITLESSEQFAPMALRFGKNVVSTIPMTEFPPLPTDQERLEKLLGSWTFTYSIDNNNFTQQYTFTSIQQFDRLSIVGTDPSGKIIVGVWDIGQYYVADRTSLSTARVFTFNFTDANTVNGCYTEVDLAAGTQSRCYPLTGTRK